MIVRQFVLVGITVFLFSFAVAQRNSQDLTFSGKWALNEKESITGLPAKFYEEYTITIIETGSEFSVERRSVRNGTELILKSVYYTDERGEINFLPSENSPDIEVKSKTKRKGNSVKGSYKYKEVESKKGLVNIFSGTYEYTLKQNGYRMVLTRRHMDEFTDLKAAMGGAISSRGITRLVFDKIGR